MSNRETIFKKRLLSGRTAAFPVELKKGGGQIFIRVTESVD